MLHIMNKCPSCKQKIASADNLKWLPFCSERCKKIDLGAWASDHYRIPGSDPSPMDGQDDPSAQH
jgi:endogenous inhibitor of DNA gyrase (YacG/DUF329 family)